MKFYMLDGNEKILCAVPSKDIISLYQNLNYHQADTIEGSLVLSEKYTSILSNVRYFAISDRESNHNFYLYRKTLVQVQNHEIAINGQGAFWDEMQGAYIKDRRPNQVTPADTIKLILGYSRWNVDYVDQMLEEESLRRDMNFYYVSLLDALNTVYQTWQVDIEPYINIEGHQITRRYVKLYQQQGGNNGRRFVYGDNALTVTQQANEGSIFTALVGRGAGVEETDADGNLTGGYSRKINFADVEWSKANGDPVDKPKGQEYVEWKESTEIYGYSDGKPRIGIVDFDNEKDPAQLLKETWAQLQQVGVPLVQFQATVGDVGYLNLGETVTIVRYDLDIKYQTRVTGIKWNRCDEAKSQITIGVKAIQSTADKIAGLQQSVAQANVNADEAKSTANHAIIDGTGAVVNYGPNEPTNPKEGDIWYDVQPDGTVVLKQYQNGQWVILIDDTTGQQIKNKVEAQQKELDKAVQDANAASAKADGLVAQVGDANTNAQKALTTAQQNQADLAQAKNDLENTKNQLTNVQSDLTGTKSSLAGAISNISQAQEDLKNTEQSLQGVKSSLANDEKNLSDLTKQAQTQGQTIVDIQKTQSGLSADVADVKGNVSSLQDTANSLQATVKDNQGNISKLQDTANSLQSSIADNKNNIASIKQTAGNIQSTVASMQNAGENLIVNSDFEQGNYHWNLNGWQISNDDEFRNHKIISKTQSGLGSANYNDFNATDLIPVQKGQTISIGVWVKANNIDSSGDGNWGATFGVNWYADNHSGRNHWTDFDDRTYYGNHDWQFLKMEGLQPPSDSHFARAHFFLTQNGSAQFALPIMVYGDTLPAWSPSPYDMASQDDLSSVEQTVSSLTSTIQSHSGQISQLKQTIDGVKIDVANSKSDISSLQQRADSMESNISDNKNDISDLRQTANSLQSNIQSKADISQITQLSNAFQTVVQNIGPFYPDGDFSDVDLGKYYDPWDTCPNLDNFSVVTNNKDWGYYLQIYTPHGTINKAITKEYLPINAQYSLTFKGKSLLSYDGKLNGSFMVYMHFFDSNKNAIQNQASYYKYDNNNVWQDFSLSFTPPSNAAYVRVETVLDNNKGDGAYWGALDNLSLDNGGSTIASKISQMSDDINLRVQKGDLLSQINIQAGSTLIQSKKLFLDASSVVFSGNAFIPSAAITDLSADKITAGTLNAGNVNIINLDVNKLVGNTTEFVRSGWTNAYGSHVQIDGGGMAVSYGDWYTRFNGNGMTFKDGNEVLGGFTRVGMVSAPSWYNGLGFNAGGDAEFLSIGAQDYGNDSQNPVPAKLLWMRQGINTYGYQPGWNFCDDVWMNKLAVNSFHYGNWDIKFGLISGSNGYSALTLTNGSGGGFFWGSDGGFGFAAGGHLYDMRGKPLINEVGSNGVAQSWTNINY